MFGIGYIFSISEKILQTVELFVLDEANTEI